MALVRTDRLLELGGYDCQWLYGLEDWELNQRLFSLGEPMVVRPGARGQVHASPAVHDPRGTVIVAVPTESANLRPRVTPRIQRNSARAFTIRIVGTIWASAGWSSQRRRQRPGSSATGPPRLKGSGGDLGRRA